MKKFTELTGLVAPMDRANVDTDAIIPKQYLKSIKRSGFGVSLFDDWRYLDAGGPESDHNKRRPNPEFVLNKARYQGAEILLARENFGCGSSREHAVWALDDFGFRVVIASSFADIFRNNCFKSGLLPVVLTTQQIDELFKQVLTTPGCRFTVGLEKQILTAAGGEVFDFEMDVFRKHCLQQGLDDIGLTLQHAAEIKRFEQQHKNQSPWLFKENP